jgi:integrase
LGTLWELYKAAYQSGATRGGGRSVKTLESQWRVWLQRWESKRLTAISDRMVETLRDDIRTRRSTTLANKIIVHGRAMYAFAARSRRIKYTGVNPFALVDKFPEKRSRKQRLKQSDIEKFFAALETVTPGMRDFFLCCLFIGARAGNVKTMRWQDLDLDGGVWFIPMTKSGEPHEVSLAEPVIELLRIRKTSDSDTWVFPAESESGHLETYRKAWLHVCEAAGIKNLRVHDLRRTLSSWAQEAKVSVALVQAQLGHLDPKTTLKHYTTIAGSARRTAVDDTVRAMMQAAKVTKH